MVLLFLGHLTSAPLTLETLPFLLLKGESLLVGVTVSGYQIN